MEINVKELTGKEICNIIKECAVSKVSELELGSLKIRFDIAKNPYEDIHMAYPGVDAADSQSGKIDSDLPTKKEFTEEDKENIKIALEDQMALEDPLMFEHYMVNNVMADGENNGEDESRGA